ncbi:hypothetical protein N7467_005140 [Penicillium canescens]|nr:hypothetical protein N7467_005140 [Penicillium canescens]
MKKNCLSKSLESSFSTTTPFTRLVLFVCPYYEGLAQLSVGDSSVELPGDDLNLLHSGRP